MLGMRDVYVNQFMILCTVYIYISELTFPISMKFDC